MGYGLGYGVGCKLYKTLQNITKYFRFVVKSLQNFTKLYKTLQSILDSLLSLYNHSILDSFRDPCIVVCMALDFSDFDAEGFAFLVFRNSRTSDGVLVYGWSDFCKIHEEETSSVFPKGKGPSIFVGTSSNNTRQNATALTVNSTNIDIDESLETMQPVFDACALLKKADCSYLLQWRRSGESFKVHLIIPYAKPYFIENNVSNIQIANAAITEALLPKVKYDKAVTKAVGLMNVMTRRPNQPDEEITTTEVFTGSKGLNPVSLIGPGQMRPNKFSEPKVKKDITENEAIAMASSFTKAVLTFCETSYTKKGWFFECPHKHHNFSANKTMVSITGVVTCMSDKCAGKPQAWFLEAFPEQFRKAVYVEAKKHVPTLKPPPPYTTVPTAHHAMDVLLRTIKPVQRDTAIIRVTTGAGKTHAIAKFLSEYSMSFDDEPGKSSILSLPTNKLLHEVQSKLTIPHKKKTGVLAVLNDDGTYACVKREKANELQSSGANIHRQVCAFCEYKNDCPAIKGATSGEGELLITNHALAPNEALTLQSNGRFPLVVWDESPQWVDSADFTELDVLWLDEQVQSVLRKKYERDLFKAMASVSVISIQIATALRPIVNCMKFIVANSTEGFYSTRECTQDWLKLHSSYVQVRAACRLMKIPSDVPMAKRFDVMLDALVKAKANAQADVDYSSVTDDLKTKILRIETLIKNLQIIGQEDAYVAISTSPNTGKKMSFTALSRSASILRSSGGVVMDATACTFTLNKIRPGAQIIDLNVEDGTKTERYMYHTVGVSRTAKKISTEMVERCVKEAKLMAERLARLRGFTLKPAVFVYKDTKDAVEEMWPGCKYGYFGNTRGYDEYFQEGCNVFITIGDPVANITAKYLEYLTITQGDFLQTEFSEFIDATATSELAQAHGRARNPQKTKSDSDTIFHFHFGTRIPQGWTDKNTILEPFTKIQVDSASEIT